MDIEKMINRTLINAEPFFSVYLHSKGASEGVAVSGTFELTSRCNFNCKMCYVHNSDSNSCKAQERSAEWWIDLGKKATEQGMIFLLLTGGEPLLREDFAKIYTELSKLGLVISINTNGSLLSGEILELFKKIPPARLNISLYGASEETYKKFTGLPAFDRVIENIKAVKDMGIDVRLNVSFTADNYEDYEGIYRLSRELNCHVKATPYMYPQVLVGEAHGINNCRLSPELAARNRVDWLRCLHTGEDYLKRLKSTLDGVDAFELSCDEEVVEGKVRCRAGRSSFWVNYKGEMCFCGVAGHPFSIDQYGFEEAWNRVKAFSSEIRTPQKCENCKLRHLCCVCAAACYTETGSFSGVPEYVCRFSELTAQLMKSEAERLEDNNGN